jgi:hypothetical protein
VVAQTGRTGQRLCDTSKGWCTKINAVSNAIGYAKFYSRSHDAVIGVYDDAGNMIETHEHKGEFGEV